MPILDLLYTPYTCPPLTPGWPTTYTSYREIAYRDFAMYDVQVFVNTKTRTPKLRCHLSSALVVPRVT